MSTTTSTTKTVAIIGTYDTKSESLAYLRDQLHDRGLGVVAIDAGVYSDGNGADVTPAEVAAAAGGVLQELRDAGKRHEALTVMALGTSRLVDELVSTGAVHAVIAAGGAGNVEVAARAMRALPLGLPKVLLTTLAAGSLGGMLRGSDIIVMNPIVDTAAMNAILRRSLRSAAGALHGLLDAETPVSTSGPRQVYATMFGITTPCVARVASHVERAGAEAVIFHATGAGGEMMEKLIRSEKPVAVLDVTTTEWADEVVGGVCSAGPTRLTAAGQTGVPQVIVPGAVDAANFSEAETVPEKYRARVLHQHGSTVTLMRTTAEENREIARRMVGNLSLSIAPVTVVIPLGGFSALDAPGQPFWDPEADAAFVEEIRSVGAGDFRIVTTEHHINDPEFADVVFAEYLALSPTPNGAD